ncbi:cyclase family protein [Colwellia sp. MEBiC06753]
MLVNITLADNTYTVNTAFGFNAAISLDFNQTQPNHFSAEIAKSTPMQAGGFIGDTKQGGSCNVNELSFNPHCNGTHTETIRHICHDDSPLSLAIADISLPPLMPCVLLSVTPVSAAQTDESYTPALNTDDRLITRAQLAKVLDNYSLDELQALAVRTLPNDDQKLSAHYNEQHQPAFFTREAMLYLNERGIEHLIVDIPSIDRLHDDGLLTNHHLFWQVAEGMHQALSNSLINKTITELAYFNTDIDDGFYFINLQTPAFANDAAPSRPVLYPATLLDNT